MSRAPAGDDHPKNLGDGGDVRCRGAPAATTLPRRLVPSSDDLSFLARRCQGEARIAGSVEVRGVDDVDQGVAVDPPAEVLGEQFGDAPVLVWAQGSRVRCDDHLRHLPQQ